MPGAKSRGWNRHLSLGIVLDHPEDVVGVEDQVILVIQPDLGPRVLGEDYDVALVDLDPVLGLPDRDNLRHLRLLLGRVRQYDARGRRLLALDHLYQGSFAKWSELHLSHLLELFRLLHPIRYVRKTSGPAGYHT